MAAYTWPVTLPQRPLRPGFGESMAINTLRTPMDNGPAKTRRRSARPAPMSCDFMMTGAQVEILRDFITNTLFGIRRFNFTHPRLQTSVEVRILTGSDGDYYKLSALGGDLWNVALSLEVLP